MVVAHDLGSESDSVEWGSRRRREVFVARYARLQLRSLEQSGRVRRGDVGIMHARPALQRGTLQVFLFRLSQPADNTEEDATAA